MAQLDKMSSYETYLEDAELSGFTCYACNAEFDAHAIDVLGARIFKVAGHNLCLECYEDYDYHMNLLSLVLTEIAPVKQCLACWFAPCRCNK